MLETRIIEVDPKQLRLLEENARFMTHEQFARLVDNVRRDGRLSSVPFAWKDPSGRWEVLSGNHRVKAAVEAGLPSIHLMVTEQPLTKDQRLAIQLSHNSTVGQDDPVTLARLYSDIGDIDLRAYSGLDDSVLALLPDVDVAGISEINLDSRTLLFMFLPHELDSVKQAFDDAMALAPSSDEQLVGSRADYDRLLSSMADVEQMTGVRNRATALRLILSLFEAHKHELAPASKADGKQA